MAEPITNVGRVAVGAFTNSLFKRWEKIISRIKKSNAKAASAIARIPPYSQHIFGGDHTQLAIVGARTSLLLPRDPTINAHPRVVVEEVVTTMIARARVVVDKKSGAGMGKDSYRGGKAPREGKNYNLSTCFER